ncbi:MAG: NAD-dependent epimerase/dehydratase family protein [Fimbriimonadia bacterium]
MQAQPEPKRAVVTGGAGFPGSYLAERFIREGRAVMVLDNLIPCSPRSI